MDSDTFHSRLGELNLKLPPAPQPVAAYVPSVLVDGMVYISGQLPMVNGELLATGQAPTAQSVHAAQAAAKQCCLNALAVLGDAINGDWSRLKRIVRLGVFVASDDKFTQQPLIANGASELLQELFGEAGRHARAAVGVNVLPLGATVELELTAHVV